LPHFCGRFKLLPHYCVISVRKNNSMRQINVGDIINGRNCNLCSCYDFNHYIILGNIIIHDFTLGTQWNLLICVFFVCLFLSTATVNIFPTSDFHLAPTLKLYCWTKKIGTTHLKLTKENQKSSLNLLLHVYT
jgi:hypothetical protein